MTDEEIQEIIQRCRQDETYREFVKSALALDDPIDIAAVTMYSHYLTSGIPAEEAACHVADYLMNQGRTDVAESIINNYIPSLRTA